MRRISAVQLAVIGAAFVITVLLSFVHTWPAQGKTIPQATVDPANSVSFDNLIRVSRSTLKPDLQSAVNIVEASITSERDANKRAQLFDSIIHLLSNGKQYVMAAYFSEQKAIKNNGNSADWEQVGERYRNAASFIEDQNSVTPLMVKARSCFDKALALDANNLDAKVGIAICIVESPGGNPMDGITMLLDVVAKDSNNVNAQLALGDFSVKRNAPDKAIVRYKNAMRIQPEFYGLHLNIADLYVQMGDTASAIGELQAYVQKETDPQVKNDVQNAILRLQHHTPTPQ
jgi:tetratricopeptide (TPR) repeat protein